MELYFEAVRKSLRCTVLAVCESMLNNNFIHNHILVIAMWLQPSYTDIAKMTVGSAVLNCTVVIRVTTAIGCNSLEANWLACCSLQQVQL